MAAATAVLIETSGTCSAVRVPRRSGCLPARQVCPGIDGSVSYLEVELAEFHLDFWYDDNGEGKQLPRNAVATDLLQRLNIKQVLLGPVVCKRRGLDQHEFATEDPEYDDLVPLDAVDVLASLRAAIWPPSPFEQSRAGWNTGSWRLVQPPGASVPTLGARVEVWGLQAQPQHNGHQGFVVEHHADRGRWGVRLDSGIGLSLREQNLSIVSAIRLELAATSNTTADDDSDDDYDDIDAAGAETALPAMLANIFPPSLVEGATLELPICCDERYFQNIADLHVNCDTYSLGHRFARTAGGVEWTSYTHEDSRIQKNTIVNFDTELRLLPEKFDVNAFAMGWLQMRDVVHVYNKLKDLMKTITQMS